MTIDESVYGIERYASIYWEPYYDEDTDFDDEAYESEVAEQYKAIDGELLRKIWDLNKSLDYFDVYMEDEMFGGRYIRVDTVSRWDLPQVDKWDYESERHTVDDWLSTVPREYGFPSWESDGGYTFTKVSSMSGRSKSTAKPRASAKPKTAARRRDAQGRFVSNSTKSTRTKTKPKTKSATKTKGTRR